jgi:hypothetical protein
MKCHFICAWWCLLFGAAHAASRELLLQNQTTTSCNHTTQIYNSFIITNFQGLTAHKLNLTSLKSRGAQNRVALQVGYGTYASDIVKGLFGPPTTKNHSQKVVTFIKGSSSVYEILDAPCPGGIGNCQVVYGSFSVCVYKPKRVNFITSKITKATQVNIGAKTNGIDKYIKSANKKAVLKGVYGVDPVQPQPPQERCTISYINNAYLIYNTIGLTAADLGYPNTTNAQFASRTTSTTAKQTRTSTDKGNSQYVSSTFSKIKKKLTGSRLRMLLSSRNLGAANTSGVDYEITCLEYTIATFLIKDVECPSSEHVPTNSLCQTVYFQWTYQFCSPTKDQAFADGLAATIGNEVQSLIRNPYVGVEYYLVQVDPTIKINVLEHTPANVTVNPPEPNATTLSPVSHAPTKSPTTKRPLPPSRPTPRPT